MTRRTAARPWLTAEDIASVLACHPETVLRMIRRGDLPGLKYGHVIRVSPEAFDAFLARHTTGPADRRITRPARTA